MALLKTTPVEPIENKDLEVVDLKSLSPWLRKLWKEKVQFNKRRLGLSNKKAREWASRTVNILAQSERK